MEKTEKEILQKLSVRNIWGSKHLRLDTILKSGWKPHDKRRVKRAIKSLIKKELLVWAKKEKKALQLNLKKAKQIRDIIEGEKCKEL